jgi:hypothetical protein
MCFKDDKLTIVDIWQKHLQILENVKMSNNKIITNCYDKK